MQELRRRCNWDDLTRWRSLARSVRPTDDHQVEDVGRVWKLAIRQRGSPTFQDQLLDSLVPNERLVQRDLWCSKIIFMNTFELERSSNITKMLNQNVEYTKTISFSTIRLHNKVKIVRWKNYQLINEHPEGEAIDLLRVLLLPVVLDNFWSHEPLRSAETLGTRGQSGPTNPVICQFRVDSRCFYGLRWKWSGHLPDKNVFRFQISVDDMLLVQVFQGSGNLKRIDWAFFFVLLASNYSLIKLDTQRLVIAEYNRYILIQP